MGAATVWRSGIERRGEERKGATGWRSVRVPRVGGAGRCDVLEER
jgi:hypothetical protein